MSTSLSAPALPEQLLALYEAALPSTRQGALFNAFSYPTKISAEAVALFIATHTRPGDTVLDTFAGSGSTGIAAVLAERPTDRMLVTAAALNLAPQWGPRNAVLYDISEIGTLAARVMTSPPPPAEFALAVDSLLAQARASFEGLYAATDPDGAAGAIRHIIWTEHIECVNCSQTTAYADARVRYAPLRFADEWTCSHCDATNSAEKCRRATETYNDPILGLPRSRRIRTPWRIYGTTGTTKWSRPATEEDANLALAAESFPLPPTVGSPPLKWGDLYRRGYHFGITHLHDLYTRRNFLAVATCWALVAEFPEHLREALQLWILSYNASHSTLMTRVVLKKDSKDFVLTGAQSGVLYVSGLPVEKNVFQGLQRKRKTFVEAFTAVYGRTSEVDVITGSSASLNLSDESIDYCFTDPPFGDYIPYAEINQINELWLPQQTDTRDEAVVSVSQNKTIDTYEGLLTTVFSEITRVLKPGRFGTIVFHSAKADVWRSLSSALSRGGLSVVLSSVLDKKQGSFKQVSGQDSVKGDPLLLVQKSSSKGSFTQPDAARSEALASRIFADALERDDLSELSRERLYSRFVGISLAEGVPITVDARTFYARYAQVGPA